MKVKDLIENLKSVDQNATVIITSNNFEHNGAQVAVSYITASKIGEKRKESFRDAFDGGTYKKEVWSTSGGKESVIKIS